MSSVVKSILKGLRFIAQLFESKEEPEMQIGLPIDVKHVSHIGLDGSSANEPENYNFIFINLQRNQKSNLSIESSSQDSTGNLKQSVRTHVYITCKRKEGTRVRTGGSKGLEQAEQSAITLWQSQSKEEKQRGTILEERQLANDREKVESGVEEKEEKKEAGTEG
ncbi:CRIB domain-containing protein RIC5-like [Mangifera indica]|uniref:CRIB domain-containing protein RIC5-like n=1 Tax=Mangifera indica TaxID=29780 RepID=UPI001CFA075E|nr:CRIB domain-containing protein RIC5-like [Mangifera indica]